MELADTVSIDGGESWLDGTLNTSAGRLEYPLFAGRSAAARTVVLVKLTEACSARFETNHISHCVSKHSMPQLLFLIMWLSHLHCAVMTRRLHGTKLQIDKKICFILVLGVFQATGLKLCSPKILMREYMTTLLNRFTKI